MPVPNKIATMFTTCLFFLFPSRNVFNSPQFILSSLSLVPHFTCRRKRKLILLLLQIKGKKEYSHYLIFKVLKISLFNLLLSLKTYLQLSCFISREKVLTFSLPTNLFLSFSTFPFKKRDLTWAAGFVSFLIF